MEIENEEEFYKLHNIENKEYLEYSDIRFKTLDEVMASKEFSFLLANDIGFGVKQITKRTFVEEEEVDLNTDDDLKSYFMTRVRDLVSDLFYYGRKSDEELSVKDVENLVEKGLISVNEIIDVFRTEIAKQFPEIKA